MHIVLIGGGVVGLATALEALSRDPSATVEVLEKEPSVACHQTGRNSGVVHSGLYYRPGSLKARTCREGKSLIETFAKTHGIPYERTGKVVVATDESERTRLGALAERAAANGVPHELIDRDGLRAIEPHVEGVEAMHVPGSGIIDYVRTCEVLAREIGASGRGQVTLSARVETVSPSATGAEVRLADGRCLGADHVVNCAGLHSDRVARASGSPPESRIVPFRGEYYELTPDAQHLVRGLVYPVPDPRFPFLGVHFTRMVTGGVECGPNAVFALAREGYTWLDVSPRDVLDALVFPGTLRLFARHWWTGLGEVHRSFSKRAFLRALQRLLPEIRVEHLVRAPSGVRAQALTRDGTLVDDFLIDRQGAITHVINAPSPAATAALAIARVVMDRALA